MRGELKIPEQYRLSTTFWARGRHGFSQRRCD
ncbi:unnamed protein product [Larinioides sclopetarius]|uniref:Uncharacterized protein n=1 Tax=Larinioides sclopetarius TaxID=280406 RepID=A0AAV1ZQM0_9ARAC